MFLSACFHNAALRRYLKLMERGEREGKSSGPFNATAVLNNDITDRKAECTADMDKYSFLKSSPTFYYLFFYSVFRFSQKYITMLKWTFGSHRIWSTVTFTVALQNFASEIQSLQWEVTGWKCGLMDFWWPRSFFMWIACQVFANFDTCIHSTNQQHASRVWQWTLCGQRFVT